MHEAMGWCSLHMGQGYRHSSFGGATVACLGLRFKNQGKAQKNVNIRFIIPTFEDYLSCFPFL
jgi:hypothetical protein